MKEAVFFVIACFHFAVNSHCHVSSQDIFHVSVVSLLCFVSTGFSYFLCYHDTQNLQAMRFWTSECVIVIMFLCAVLQCDDEYFQQGLYVFGVFYFIDVITSKCHVLLSVLYSAMVCFYVWQIGPSMPVFFRQTKCPDRTHLFFVDLIIVQVVVPVLRFCITSVLAFVIT